LNKVLVCGGRDYNNYKHITEILDRNRALEPISHIIHGGAAGADTLAGLWATKNGIQEVICPANWDVHKHSAGYLRNKAMLALNPDLVIAFPGHNGTKMMVKIARVSGIKVIDFNEKT